MSCARHWYNPEKFFPSPLLKANIQKVMVEGVIVEGVMLKVCTGAFGGP